MPTQLLLRLGGVGIASGDITGAALDNAIRHGNIVHAAKGIDHIQYAIAHAGAQIEDAYTGLFVTKSCYVTLGKIHHVNIVTHTGTVGVG